LLISKLDRHPLNRKAHNQGRFVNPYRLPAIVHSVEKGPPVKLTRRGRPVAMLLSIKEYEKLSGKQIGFWDALTALRGQAENLEISDEDFEKYRDT
jgi:prevent-host-death family protein